MRSQHEKNREFGEQGDDADIALLAQVDREFGTLSVPATAHVLRRAFDEMKCPLEDPGQC